MSAIDDEQLELPRARVGALFGPGAWNRLVYRLRTEADSPMRQAVAIALGTFIGCTPFYGFHLLLCVAFGSLFRVNRLKVYVAANISNPLMAPFLTAAELQIGSWLTRGSWYSPSTLRASGLWGITSDLLIGSVALGAALAVVTSVTTYVLVKRQAVEPAIATLIDRASSRYLRTSCTSWEFANGKLRMDPVYLNVLKRGILPDEGTLVDVGCGQGLMLALLASARELRDEAWPRGWPQPPRELQLIGIENRPRMVKKARAALGGDADIIDGDLRDRPMPSCRVTLLFDVLHLVPHDDQEQFLARVRQALEPGGLLIVREADAAGSLRFRAVQLVNWTTRILQGHWRRRFYFRSASDWRACMTRAGFEVEAQPMAEGTPFANLVFYARRRPD